MISHSVVGQGNQTIAFIHGLFGRGTNFLTLAKLLAPNYRCVLIDAPNHGASSWTDSLDLRRWANLIVDHLEQLGVCGSDLTLLGHSMGGKIAMYAALDRPDSIGRLIVEDMSAANYQLNGEFMPYIEAMLQVDLASLTSRSQADQLLGEKIPDPQVRGFLLQNLRKSAAGWDWQLNLELLRAELGEIGLWHSVAKPAFENPVLWVGGQKSSFVQPKYEPLMRQHFPKLHKVVVKNAGHWIHAEKPAVLAEVIGTFLERTPANSTD